MALRTMKGPEPLWRVKIVRHKTIPNPAYTGYGCEEPTRLLTDELITDYYGPYVARHGAVTVHKSEGYTREYDYDAGKRGPNVLRWDVVSADIETCEPEWKVIST
jgi:hypothetical protein